MTVQNPNRKMKVRKRQLNRQAWIGEVQRVWRLIRHIALISLTDSINMGMAVIGISSEIILADDSMMKTSPPKGTVVFVAEE